MAYEKLDEDTLLETKSEVKTIDTRREWKISEVKAKIAALQKILDEATKAGIDINKEEQ